jgi:hypothetical protein
MSAPSSPKVKIPKMDTSLAGWIYNIRSVLYFPSTVITVLSLIIIGTFAERCPRGYLEYLNNVLGMSFIFIAPLLIAVFNDWPTGLLAAVVGLVVIARLQISIEVSEPEGFMGSDSVQTTKLVSNSHRWFVEKVLGETPVAISSDRIQTKRTEDNDNRTSSSSSMSSIISSDGTK